MTDGIVGRDPALGAIDEFLAEVQIGPGVLLIEGEAGAGKTTLWRAAVAGAVQREFRVLSCRAAATEAKLSFGGLDDLLHGVVGEVSDSLPAPQPRRSHRIAARVVRVAKFPALTPVDVVASMVRPTRIGQLQPERHTVVRVDASESVNHRSISPSMVRRHEGGRTRTDRRRLSAVSRLLHDAQRALPTPG